MQNRTFNLVRQTEDTRDHLFLVAGSLGFDKLVDLRPKMPIVYDQGALGSCAANVGAAAISYLLKNRVRPSRLLIYYCCRVMQDRVNEDCGTTIRDTMKVINQNGVCKETLWPYQVSKFAEKPSETATKAAQLIKSTRYKAVGQSQYELQAALATGFPVAFGQTIKESFVSEEVAKSGVYKPELTEKTLGGHALLLVGYYYEGNSLTAIIRNSWGRKWGKAGYFTMPFSLLLNPELCFDFWVINTMTSPSSDELKLDRKPVSADPLEKPIFVKPKRKK